MSGGAEAHTDPDREGELTDTASPELPEDMLRAAVSQLITQHAHGDATGLNLAEFSFLLRHGDLHEVFGFIP